MCINITLYVYYTSECQPFLEDPTNLSNASTCCARETSRPARSVPKLLDFLLFQHTEGFAREILAVDFFGINAERRAQFVAGETVEMGVAGVPLSAEVGANRENKNLPSL